MELPVSVETTSQHAEYEGLLMGLEWLIEFLSCQDGNQEILFGEDLCNEDGRDGDEFALRKPDQKGRALLTIEGDCKTVIDQLMGKSIPRKLESLHQRAERLLNKLGSMHLNNADSGVESNANDQFQTKFRHIPRSQNPISDSLCNNLMKIISAKSWIGSIHQLEEAANQIMDTRPSSSQVPASSLPLSKVYETAIGTTRFSLRPPLYEMVANLAGKTENYKLLVNIGERIIDEDSSLDAYINIRPPQEGEENGCNDSSKSRARMTATSLKRRGIDYQIRGWKGMGKEKKVQFLKRKYRILLSNDDHESDEVINDELTSSTLKKLGDVTEVEWNSCIPLVWKPILDEWFVSARYQHLNERAEENLAPIWISAV